MRILFVTAFPQFPTGTGDRQRSNFIYRALSRVGHTDTLLLSLYSQSHHPELMQRMTEDFSMVGNLVPEPVTNGLQGKLRRLSPKLVDRAFSGAIQLTGGEYRTDPLLARGLAETLAKQRYDLIVGRYIRTTAQSGALDYTPVVIDVDDYDVQVFRDRLASPELKGALRWATSLHHRNLERVVPRRIAAASHLWVAAESDVSEVPHPHVSALPNLAFFKDGEAAPPVAPPARDSQVILTVGNLNAPMNVHGIDRFVTRAWPRIHAAAPKATFRIVGGSMSDAMRSRWGAIPGVEPIGFVLDLGEEYARSAFTVAPIYEGGGTKIKVLESLNRGRTVAMMRHSLRGYEHALRHGEDVWVADSDADLAEGCVRLLASPDLRDAYAAHGAVQARAFSFSRFCEIVKSTVERVTADGGGVQRAVQRGA